MAPEPKLILTDRPSDTAQAVIDGRLAQYNEEDKPATAIGVTLPCW